MTAPAFHAGVPSPGGSASYRVFFDFIAPATAAEFRGIVGHAPEELWLTGQRKAPGYSRLDLDKFIPISPSMAFFLAHARQVLAEATGSEPGAWNDCWLLRYLAGGNIPDHVDPVPGASAARYRLNVLLSPEASSGLLWVAGRLVGMHQHDAVIFSSGTLMHRVDPVPELRLVLSLGMLAPKEEP